MLKKHGERDAHPPLRQLAGAQLARQAVEHAVDHPGLVALEEGVRHLDVLADDDAGRHVRELHQLEGGRAQDGAHDGIDARQAPALGQLPVDHRIDLALAPHHALEQAGKMLRVGLRRRIVLAYRRADGP